MTCSYCGKIIEKGEKFICVGNYPSFWAQLGARVIGPEYFGETYHERCFLESLKKQQPKQKEEDR